ncbi:hypothetical protein BDD43_0651 [Mucilaginibacter gracilis]|uniref:Uncharacterized protein n=1 Tax=Mucilaginibacter gracilis TaxID=423350 RepID=A0A495IUZ0_9SPHI|nr:hypothetical protein [Mucilaginibacter gracilis]RKR80530.1 hypothetical protein BDD43_0651 [Mucilaginibacter gracilis]
MVCGPVSVIGGYTADIDHLIPVECWATYCEASILAARYGDTITKVFFASQRANYLIGGYEGRANLATDYNDSGVSYGKVPVCFYVIKPIRQRKIRCSHAPVYSFGSTGC